MSRFYYDRPTPRSRGIAAYAIGAIGAHPNPQRKKSIGIVSSRILSDQYTHTHVSDFRPSTVLEIQTSFALQCF